MIVPSFIPGSSIAAQFAAAPSGTQKGLVLNNTGTGNTQEWQSSGTARSAVNPSFFQAGPDTYGVSGWSGYNLDLECYRLAADTANLQSIYIEIYGGDIAGTGGVAFSGSINTVSGGTHNYAKMYGINFGCTSLLGSGRTVDALYGCLNEASNNGNGTVTEAYGQVGSVSSFHGTTASAYGVQGKIRLVGGAITTAYSFHSPDLSGMATNPYYAWYDSRGVYRIKEENSQAITALYNPAVTKYTPGATDFERIIQQWNSSVAEYGVEVGGTGTLRSLRLLGASVLIGGSTSANAASALTIDSTTKGFLPPRMTSTQRDAISSPPAGLLIYNTTTGAFNGYTSSWGAIGGAASAGGSSGDIQYNSSGSLAGLGGWVTSSGKVTQIGLRDTTNSLDLGIVSSAAADFQFLRMDNSAPRPIRCDSITILDAAGDNVSIVGTGTAGIYFREASTTGTVPLLMEMRNGTVRAGKGAVATNATDGFVYLPTCAGTPTGTPTAYSGWCPFVVDTTNHKAYFYDNGGWIALN